jgi:hypothetical protein
MARMQQARAESRVIRDIELGLRSLSKGLRRLARQIGASTNGRPVRRHTVTPALRLQGRYMGLIRTLPVTKKNRVMAIRAKKGVEAAIRMARELRGNAS